MTVGPITIDVLGDFEALRSQIAELVELIEACPLDIRERLLERFLGLLNSDGDLFRTEDVTTGGASCSILLRVSFGESLERFASALRAGDFHSA